MSSLKWKITPEYALLEGDQRNPGWLAGRKKRVTASVIGSCVGHNLKFTTPEKEACYITGLEKKVFTPQQQGNMNQGTADEPMIRDWYCKTNGVTVVEAGLIVPRWEDRIGASVDGIVISQDKLTQPLEKYTVLELLDMGEGIIEIKRPANRFYQPLIDYSNNPNRKVPSLEDVSNDSDIWNNYFHHIWQSHFDQMQMGMACLRKPWCDYVVYQPGQSFVQRIPYCHSYFTNQLLIPARQFIETLVDPILKEHPELGFSSPIPWP